VTVASSPTSDLIVGFARTLDSAGIGLTYAEDTGYGPDDVAIVEATERVLDNAQVVLNWVALDDDVDVTQGTGILQVGIIGLPGDRRSPNDISWAVFGVLQQLTGAVFGSVSITDCWRQSSVPMGTDERDRTSRADQYRVTVEYPPTSHRQ
jgi:hypothetical protein